MHAGRQRVTGLARLGPAAAISVGPLQAASQADALPPPPHPLTAVYLKGRLVSTGARQSFDGGSVLFDAAARVGRSPGAHTLLCNLLLSALLPILHARTLPTAASRAPQHVVAPPSTARAALPMQHCAAPVALCAGQGLSVAGWAPPAGQALLASAPLLSCPLQSVRVSHKAATLVFSQPLYKGQPARWLNLWLKLAGPPAEPMGGDLGLTYTYTY